MKINKIFPALAAALLFTAASCTDSWNEHYEAQSLGQGSLMDKISSDPSLSNFRDVLVATGFDKELASSQVYTVFAPTNSNFTEAERDALIADYQNEMNTKYGNDQLKNPKTYTVKEFIQNHISLYNYSVSPSFKDTYITMLNGKVLPLTKNSFDGHPFIESNIALGNGILYTIDGEAAFKANIMEMIEKLPQISRVKDFLYMKSPYVFMEEKFYPAKSVVGEIRNGKQEYLDSVTETNFKIPIFFDADLVNEDSTYNILLPTNEEWDKQLQRNEQYFKYAKGVTNADSLSYFYPRYFIINGTSFSKKVNPNIDEQSCDSALSTLYTIYSLRKQIYGSYDIKYYQYDKPWGEGGIFQGAQQNICSNGKVLVSDNWKVKPTDTFLRNIRREAEIGNAEDSLMGIKAEAKPKWEQRTVSADNPFYEKVSDHSFMELTTSTASTPWCMLAIPDVLSNIDYDIYVTFVPACALDIETTDIKPTRVQFTLYWTDAKGVAMKQDEGANDGKGIDEGYKVTDADGGDVVYDRNTRVYSAEVSGTEVKTIYVGRFRFPTCSYGLDNAQVKLRCDVKVRGSAYSNVLRIDKVNFVPVVK